MTRKALLLAASALVPLVAAFVLLPVINLGQPGPPVPIDASLGPQFGSATQAPTVRLNGPAGGARGLQWLAGGSTRWALMTGTGDNLSLFAYDDRGAYVNAPLAFNRNGKSYTLSGQGNLTFSTALAQGTAGLTFGGHNTSATNTGIGNNFQYFSSAWATGVFDVGEQSVSVFNPDNYPAGSVSGSSGQVSGPGQYEGFRLALSPNDSKHNWGVGVEEWNIVNRGPDMGWFADRGENSGRQPVTGGMVMVAESSIFGDPAGGEGKHALYGYTVARSGGSNSTGRPVKFYNAFLCEPNSIVGAGESGNGTRQSYCFFGTGDLTGKAVEVPYAPEGWAGRFLHGVDYTRATFSDGAALRLAGTGQALAFVGGSTATITGTGSGASEGILLTPAGAGVFQVAGNQTIGTNMQTSTELGLNGAAATSKLITLQSAGQSQFSLGIDMGNNVAFYRYKGGAYAGNALAISNSTGDVTAAGTLSTAGYKVGGIQGVSCTAGSVSLSTLTVIAGIVTHC